MHPNWATALRVALGALLLRQGYCTLRGLESVRPEAFFPPDLARLILPAVAPVIMFGYLSVILALVGGLMMILGISVRWAAGLNGFVVGLVPLAYGLERELLTRGRDPGDAGWGPCADGWAYPALVLAGSILQMVVGSGAWALTWRGWRR
jgi:uncharacterized membrane protein YphA (DoxX/SURF4 family)